MFKYDASKSNRDNTERLFELILNEEIPANLRDENKNLILFFEETDEGEKKFEVANNLESQKLEIKFIGTNNTVIIPKTARFEKSKIIFSSNCIFFMEATKGRIINTFFMCEREKGHALVYIGKKFSCRGAYITIYPWTCICINDDCMLSTGIKLRTSDGHTIIDDLGNVKNTNQSIFIDRHCWIGNNATILKNTYIPENSIIGQNTIVTKSFFEKGSIIVGTPGKVVSVGNNWVLDPPDKVTDTSFESGKFRDDLFFVSEK